MSQRSKHNAADEDSVDSIEVERLRKRTEELDDIRRIIGTPQGLRFFTRLMAKGCVFRTTFTGNSQGYFLEGQRNLALMFFDDICTAAPDKVVDLMVVQKKD